MRIGEATSLSDLLTAAEQARTSRLDVRRGYEKQWWDNIALVGGDHYATWNPSLSRFEDRDETFDRLGIKKPRLVINHALTVGRTELSKLTKSRPIMEIIANSDESEDIAAAKVGRSVLDAAEWKFQLRKMRKRALWWMIQTGLGAIYVGWDYLDETMGKMEYMIDPNTGDPVFDKLRQRQLEKAAETGEVKELVKEEYPLGECQYKVYSPFQLLPEETAVDFDEIKNLITTELVDIDVLKGIYGRTARDVRPDGDAQLGTMEQRALMRAGIQLDTEGNMDNAVRVHTLWVLPAVYRGNKLIKNGIYFRWCNSNIRLDNSEAFPFADGRMPFVFFQHIPTSTSIWPDSVMTHIRGPNLEIDKTISQLIENKDYMANPMWLIATQHKVKGEIKNVAGAIVRYRHVPNIPPPQPVQGLQMPPQVENLLTGLRAQILDISGQSEVARGRVPTGVRSGVAVAYLQEEDDSKLSPTVENMEECIALMGSLTLERFAQFYSIPRILRYYRRDGVFDVVKFKGADLKNNTDVICQAGSAMPRSKAARQQYTLELVSLGILKDPHKIEQMLDLGSGEPDEVDKAIAQANRENNTMLYGKPKTMVDPDADLEEGPEGEGAGNVPVAIPVKKWHNHEIHLQRHKSVMMDEEFDELAISQPETVRLFDEHIAMHETVLQEMMAQQMQQLMAAKGAPDGAPGASPAAGPTGPSFRNLTEVPDVIGGGNAELTAMTTIPPSGG